MENQAESVENVYEGVSPSEAGETLPASDDIATAVDGIAESIQTETGEPATATEVPEQPPKPLTAREAKELNRRFFTIRHERLTNCSHKFKPDTPPRNNCENCWWTFFNTHKPLVELTDEFWRNHGKDALIGMRGKKYVTMFGRFMATIIRMRQEEEALKLANGNQDNSNGSSVGTNDAESVVDSPTVEGGQTQDGDVSLDILE